LEAINSVAFSFRVSKRAIQDEFASLAPFIRSTDPPGGFCAEITALDIHDRLSSHSREQFDSIAMWQHCHTRSKQTRPFLAIDPARMKAPPASPMSFAVFTSSPIRPWCAFTLSA
jgi:hypothetical protein